MVPVFPCTYRNYYCYQNVFDLTFMDLDQNDSVRNNTFSHSAKPIESFMLLGNATPVKSGN